MDAPVFLAREGKVTGPFDSKKIEEMKASGEFYKYEWMWDGQSPDWSPVPRNLASPPPLPEDRTRGLTKVPGAEAGVTSTVAQPHADADLKRSAKTFCAVLFDSRLTIGGEVSQAHSRGGKFISAPSQTVPVSKGAVVLLDLLDESTDRSTKIQSNVSQVSRVGDRWVLDLEWADCPLL